MGKLTTKTIKGLPIGKHGDGDGLQLVITAPERGKWVLRYQVAYKSREMGLGPFPLVSSPRRARPPLRLVGSSIAASIRSTSAGRKPSRFRRSASSPKA